MCRDDDPQKPQPARKAMKRNIGSTPATLEYRTVTVSIQGVLESINVDTNHCDSCPVGTLESICPSCLESAVRQLCFDRKIPISPIVNSQLTS